MNNPVSIFIGLSQNIALLAFLTFVYGIIHPRLGVFRHSFQQIINGVLFGSVGIMIMLTPLQVLPGVLLDGRTVLVAVASAYGGLRTGLTAAFMMALYRVSLGGVGIRSGLIILFTSAIIGYLVRRSRDAQTSTFSFQDLQILGIIVTYYALVWTLILPDGTGWTVIQNTWLPVVILYPIGTIFLGVLLNHEIRRYENEVALQISDTAVRFTSDGVIVSDSNNQITLANPAAAEMFGYEDAAHMIGKTMQQLISEDYHELHRAGMMRYIIAIDVTDEDPIEAEAVRANGSTFPIEVSLAPIRRDGVQGFISTIQDISERKLMEKHTRELLTERDKVQTLKGFIGEASHDLRTPITVLRTHTQVTAKHIDNMVKRTNQLNDELTVGNPDTAVNFMPEVYQMVIRVKQWIGIFEESIVWLQKLVEDLLDMARLDSDVTFSFAMHNLNGITSRAIAMYYAIASDKGISIQSYLDERVPQILADENEIARVIRNLIQNAVTYTPEGGQITIRTYALEGEVIVEVKDTGIGIPEDELPRIFTRFYRSEQARSANQTGSGLGLAIAQKILETHGGRLEVESLVNVGSTFRAKLPIHNA